MSGSPTPPDRPSLLIEKGTLALCVVAVLAGVAVTLLGMVVASVGTTGREEQIVGWAMGLTALPLALVGTVISNRRLRQARSDAWLPALMAAGAVLAIAFLGLTVVSALS